jgi:peptidoglycan DL-endopeptidase CwlO
VVAGCGLLVALGPPAAQARPRLEGHPKPPSQAQINAAENQVRQHQAALGAAQGKLSAASAELSRLQTQAEVLIERYDQAQVNEQRAASAYQVTQARLRQAERQQAASRLRVARLAARQFESGGGFSPVMVMLGDADGPQAYLRQVGMGQALAESGTETLAAKPYQWGGADPARYDCSGLTMVAWAHAGVQLLHHTGYQWQEGPHVPLSQLRRGDLLFYATNTSDPSTIHHVAIYIGSGMMVNAPYTGAFIRIDGMYQPGGLIGAVRPAG